MAPVPSESAAGPATAAYPARVGVFTAPVAGFLAWLVPGLGHLYIGQRVRGCVCLVAITATFWSGVAIGGVQATVDPHERTLWFLAQLCTGGNTLAAYGLHSAVTPARTAGDRPAFVAHWLSADVGVHYTGVAGLLNLLVILDVLGRADTPLPFRRRRDHPPGVP